MFGLTLVLLAFSGVRYSLSWLWKISSDACLFVRPGGSRPPQKHFGKSFVDEDGVCGQQHQPATKEFQGSCDGGECVDTGWKQIAQLEVLWPPWSGLWKDQAACEDSSLSVILLLRLGIVVPPYAKSHYATSLKFNPNWDLCSLRYRVIDLFCWCFETHYYTFWSRPSLFPCRNRNFQAQDLTISLYCLFRCIDPRFDWISLLHCWEW